MNGVAIRNPTVRFVRTFVAITCVFAYNCPTHARPASIAVEEDPRPAYLLKEEDGAEFRFGYLPSSNQLRLIVLRPPQVFTGWQAVLTEAQGTAEALARHEGSLPFPEKGVTEEAKHAH